VRKGRRIYIGNPREGERGGKERDNLCIKKDGCGKALMQCTDARGGGGGLRNKKTNGDGAKAKTALEGRSRRRRSYEKPDAKNIKFSLKGAN